MVADKPQRVSLLFGGGNAANPVQIGPQSGDEEVEFDAVVSGGLFQLERFGVRYSFHGKVRATGQQVDGYVEAGSSSEAIDRLADQGIIGVHTVRPEARKPRNPVTFSGEPQYEEDEAPKKIEAAPALPAPAPQPIYIPVPTPVAAAAPAGAADTATQIVLAQLVDKLATLLTQVEKVLSRPQQIVYQSGPARGGGGGEGSKRKPRQVNEAQDTTLRAIFQTNMDLRRSLDKLSTVVSNGASNGVSNGPGGSAPAAAPVTSPVAASGNGSTNGSRIAASAPAAVSVPAVTASVSSNRDGSSSKVGPGSRERVQQPQPAA